MASELLLGEVRRALHVMLTEPSRAHEASAWLHSFRNDNNSRRRRSGAKQDGPLIGFEAGACAWPVLVALATLPDASEAERLFASQGLLFRVRRFDLADALDIADPVALSRPPSSSAKASAEAAAEANEQGVATLGALVLAGCGPNGASLSRSILEHLSLTLATVVIKAGTTGPSSNDSTISADLVSMVRGAIEVAASSQLEHPAPSPEAAAAIQRQVQTAAAAALLRTLELLPEAAAVNRLSIRPRALSAALQELRSDRAGAGMLEALASHEALTSTEGRMRCVEQWLTHVGLQLRWLQPVLPVAATAVTAVVTQQQQLHHRGAALTAREALTAEGLAACDLMVAIFESSTEKQETLTFISECRVTANGRRKARRQRANNSADVEQQQLEISTARAAAALSAACAAAALPCLVQPLHAALALAVQLRDQRAVTSLSTAAAAAAASELPRLLASCASSASDASTAGGEGAALKGLLELLVVASQQSIEHNAVAITMDPWVRFRDATVALQQQHFSQLSSFSKASIPHWIIQAEAAAEAAVAAIVATTRYPGGFEDESQFDEERREEFSEWRKEVRSNFCWLN